MKKSSQPVVFSLLFLFTCLNCLASSADSPQGSYIFGVFPHLPPSEIQKVYALIAVDFSHAVQRKVNLRSTATFEKFITQLKKETFDIVLIQPFDYVFAHDQHHYTPLARWEAPLGSVIVVKKNSPYHTLTDLRGKTVANPPASAAVSHMTKMALLHAGMDVQQDVTLIYARSQLSCLQKIFLREAQACGTAQRALKLLANKVAMKKLRILHETPAIPHVLYAAHARVPHKDREAIKQAILSWPNRKVGKKIFAISKFSAFVPALDAEYDVVRDFWME